MKVAVLGMILFLFSCQIDKNSVRIEQQDSNYQVMIWANDSIDKIVSVYCHLVYDVQKLAFRKVWFYNPSQFENSDYSYYKEEWSGRPLEYDDNGIPRVIEPNDDRKMLSRQKNQYLVKTIHIMDTSFAVQQIFRPYLERMKAEGKDTLHIGSIQQLKLTNPDLINNLLQRDSIEFVFGRDDRRHAIYLPIEVR